MPHLGFESHKKLNGSDMSRTHLLYFREGVFSIPNGRLTNNCLFIFIPKKDKSIPISKSKWKRFQNKHYLKKNNQIMA